MTGRGGAVKRGNLLAAGLFIAFGIFIFIETADYPSGILNDVGAAFFPRFTAVLMILFSIVILVEEFLRARRHRGARSEERPADAGRPEDVTSAPGEAVPGEPVGDGKASGTVPPDAGALGEAKTAARESDAQSRSAGLLPLAGLAAVTAYLLLLPVLGFIVSTVLLNLGLLLLFRVRSPLMLAVFPPVMTAAVYLLFQRLLYVPLPRGLLF